MIDRSSNATEIPLISIQLDSAMNAPVFKENICFQCGKEATDPLITMSRKDRIKRVCTGCHLSYRRSYYQAGWSETSY